MARVAEHLKYYVTSRLNSDPAWKHLLVFVSDASVPGEGEHKLLDFIRAQRQNPRHDPKTRHVVVGADADLILLGLGTHELNFRILRDQGNRYRGAVDGGMAFADISRLREYLDYEFKELSGSGNLPWGEWELERAIEDFIFMRNPTT